MIHNYICLVKKIELLGGRIDAPTSYFPNVGKITQDAHPCIIKKAKSYHLITSENGIVLSENEYTDIDNLLFDVFEKITFRMAMQYELQNRKHNEDFRRVLFSNQLSLMKALSEEWGNRLIIRINNILREHPYVD